MFYTTFVECKPREKVWVRWREVPCSVAAEYLSHTGASTSSQLFVRVECYKCQLLGLALQKE